MPGQDKATARTQYTLDLAQACGQVWPHDYGVGRDHHVAGSVGQWKLVGGSSSDVDSAGALPLPAAARGLRAHDRGRADQVQAELRMALGEQGAEDARAAPDLAKIVARSCEHVSDLTLLGQAAGHQYTAEAPQHSARKEERVEDWAGRVSWLNGGVLVGHAVSTILQVAGPSFGLQLRHVVLAESGTMEPTLDLGHKSAVAAEVDLPARASLCTWDMICLTGLHFSVISRGASLHRQRP